MLTNRKSETMAALAALYLKCPNLPMPSSFYNGEVVIYCFAMDTDEAKDLVKSLGELAKVYDDSYFKVVKRLTDDTVLEVTFRRESVCTPRVVGIKRVPAKTIPAKPAKAEEIIAEHDEEIIEWDCHPVTKTEK